MAFPQRRRKRNETKGKKKIPTREDGPLVWNDGHDTNDTTKDVNVINNRKTEPQKKHTLTEDKKKE